MKNISLYSRYTSQGASSRYRFFHYLETLMSNDYNVEIHSFFYPNYLTELYASKRLSVVKLLQSYLSRYFSLIRASDCLLIEYELFPKIPYWFERRFLKNRKYILNFDDNVWEGYKNSFWNKEKFDQLTAGANGVIVANEFLYEKVTKLNGNVIKIPTVINMDAYSQTYKKFYQPTIVWIGTPVTYKYILSHAQIFQELAHLVEYELLIVGKEQLSSSSIDKVRMRFVDWSPKTEVEMLMRSHVGIMPLDHDAFSHGKSSFKLIQYMAAALPSVSTDIGENRHVVQEGVEGYVVQGQNVFKERLLRLLKDDELRKKMGERAKLKAYDFSMQKYGIQLVQFLDQI